MWIQGPYPADEFTNIKIFNKVLQQLLVPSERVDADKGYATHPDRVKCPANAVMQEEKWGMQVPVRAIHEMLNGHLKKWGILAQVFPHIILCHGNVFWGMHGGDSAHH